MKKYKKFFINTLILMIIFPVLLIFLGLIIGNHIIGKGVFKYNESEMIHKWLSQKKSIASDLNKNKKNKIVLLSGSNTLFGINAEIVEKRVGISTLNYASHKDLESYIFYDAKNILKKGDTVIMPLEYVFYEDSTEINPMPTTLVQYIISYDHGYYEQLSIPDKLKVLSYLLRFDTLTSVGKKNTEREYKLSRRGDIIGNTGHDNEVIKTLHPRKIKSCRLSPNYKNWNLHKFIKWCQENDIKVYATAPNIYHGAVTTKEEKESVEQIKEFYKKSGVNFVGKLEDSFFDLKYIYNSDYHLNKEGQKIRSNNIIKIINGFKE